MLHVRVNVPPLIPALEGLAEGLVLVNVALMEYAEQRGVELPDLYESGIVYRRESPGQEWWENALDVVGVVADRSGDCEDLAAYRCAELRHFEGQECRVKIVKTRRAYHAVVEHEDGRIEDPSRIALRLERARKRKGQAR